MSRSRRNKSRWWWDKQGIKTASKRKQRQATREAVHIMDPDDRRVARKLVHKRAEDVWAWD